MPQTVLLQLKEEKSRLLRRPLNCNDSPSDFRRQAHKRLFALFDACLDRATDHTWLADPNVAEVVRENLYHHRDKKYHVIAYCIMPNHVHLLLQPIEVISVKEEQIDIGESEDKVSPLAKIMHSLKSYTANKANALLGRSGAFWQHESYDHWVRDDEELERIVAYIRNNPVKAGLATEPQKWRYCSTYDRFVVDGNKEGWLSLPSQRIRG